MHYNAIVIIANQLVGFATVTFEISQATDDFNKRVVYVLWEWILLAIVRRV